MSFDQETLNQELVEIDREVDEIYIDLQGNSNSILLKPQIMKTYIESLLIRINQNEQRLLFFRRSNATLTKKIFTQINLLEKKMAIIKNQIELNLKTLKKMH